MKYSRTQSKAIQAFRVADRPLRTSEILKKGVHPRDLYTLRDEGVIDQVSRGVYRLADQRPLTEPDLVTIATRVPRAVVCLISALGYHGLTEEIPRTVSIAIPRRTSPPKLDWPPLSIFMFSGEMFTAGIETHTIDNVPVRIYSPAKTVADCFRFRSRVGTDVAIAALRRGLSGKDFTPAEFMAFARICRVERVVKPYMEALL